MKKIASKDRKKLINSIDTSGNLFYFEIVNKNNINIQIENLTSKLDVGLFVKSIGIPDISYDSDSQRRRGNNVFYAKSSETASANIITYLDKDNKIYKYWMDWYNTIRTLDNIRYFPDVYKMDINIYRLNRTNLTETMIIHLTGCWPSNINDLNLDWESFDNASTLNIELKVDDLTIELSKNSILEDKLEKELTDQLKKNWDKTLNDISKIKNTDKNKEILNSYLEKQKEKNINKIDDKIKEQENTFLKKVESRIKHSGELLKNELIAKAKSEMQRLLPSYLRNLDYLNLNNFLNQIGDRAEGYLINELKNLETNIVTNLEDKLGIGLDRINDKRIDTFKDAINYNPPDSGIALPYVDTTDRQIDQRINKFIDIIKYENSSIDEANIAKIKNEYRTFDLPDTTKDERVDTLSNTNAIRELKLLNEKDERIDTFKNKIQFSPNENSPGYEFFNKWDNILKINKVLNK